MACDGSEIATDADWQGLLTQAAADAKLDLQILPISYSTGNFLLMARPDWFEVGGFPEWNVADRHFDRIVMGQAHYRGWTKIVFPPSLHYFSASRLRELDLADDLYVDAEGDPRIRVESPAIRPFGDYYVISVLHRLKCIFDESPSLLPARIGANGPDWGLPGLNLPESQPLSTAQIQPA